MPRLKLSAFFAVVVVTAACSSGSSSKGDSGLGGDSSGGSGAGGGAGSGGGGGNTGVDAQGPPSGDVDQLLAPYAGLCQSHADELKAALCSNGTATSATFCDPGCTYYLATSGSDTADGKAGTATASSGPWKTLDKLRGLTFKDGDRICFRRGDTFRGSYSAQRAMHFTNPAIFQSYGDPSLPRPILSGAKVLPSTWTATSQSASIQQLDVSGALFEGTAFTSNGKTYTPHDRIFQLFVNGKLQPIARFPNIGAGDSTVRGVPGFAAGNYSVIDAQSSTTQFRDDALPASSPLQTPTNFTGAALFYKSIRWIIDTTDVTAHDSAGHTLSVAAPLSCASNGGSCLHWGYFLVDHIAALDSPGEWYYDKAAKKLYFWPPAGLNLATSIVEASVYQEDAQPPSWAGASAPPEIVTTIGIDLGASSGIRIRDLSFRYYSQAGVKGLSDLNSSSADLASSTTDIRIEGCEFLYTGANGVDLERWTAPAAVDANNRIYGCSFQNQTSEAITLRTTGTEVSCNTISDNGRLEDYPRFGMTHSEYTIQEQGMALVSEMGDRNKLLFNRFERTSSASLSFRSPDTVVAFNVFHNACFTKSDCGAIHSYTWDDKTQFNGPSISGSLIARNVVLETLGATEGGNSDDDWIDPLGQGLFLDFGSHGYAVKQNLIAGSTNCGIMHQRNRDVTTEENLLYDNTRYNAGGYLLGDLEIINDYPPTSGTFRNNQIITLSPAAFPLGLRGDQVKQAGTFQSNLYFDPFSYETLTQDTRWLGYTVLNNYGSTTALYSLAGWQTAAGETSSTGAPMSWQANQITVLGTNLISNSDFASGITGWSTESWSASKVSADTHPVLGACLKYERNGATGGRAGALSNTFALKGGHTYWIKFWIAPDTSSGKHEPFALTVDPKQAAIYVPDDKVREVEYVYTPKADVATGQFELTPYPDYPDRFWIDDVVVQEVTATPYKNSAIVRFDQALPTDVRSILIYNDTESVQAVSLGSTRYVKPDGTAQASSVSLRAFSGVVLIPEAWSKDPVKN